MKITITLILLNVLVFLFTVGNLEYYILNYGFSSRNFLSGNYWVILTSIFLHANFTHLFFNMASLFFIGSSLEKKVKGWKYLLVYFLSGFLGNFGMMIPFLYGPETVGVGASGAISGIIGFGTFVCPGNLVVFQSIIPLPFILVGVLYFLSTSTNLLVPSQVAYPVHFLGLLTGFIMGFASIKKGERKRNIIIFILLLLLVVLLPYIIEVVKWII